MNEHLPDPLKLEVKVSRTTTHQFSSRDLSGVGSDGYLAVLMTERHLHGPRWLLVPAGQLQARGYADAELCSLDDPIQADLCHELNRVWSDWILDKSVWSKLFQQDHMKIKAAIEWCLANHPPRINATTGNLREGRLDEALRLFRTELDKFLTGVNGPQEEGFIHQYLLAHALEKLNFQVTVNAVGVPDISAVKVNNDTSGQIQTLHDKLQRWKPSDTDLQNLRNILLRHRENTLKNLRDILC